MLIGHHGTHHDALPIHPGLCLAVGGSDDGYRAASEYARRSDGDMVFEVSVDLDGLNVQQVEVDAATLLRSGDDYPATPQPHAPPSLPLAWTPSRSTTNASGTPIVPCA